MNETPSGTNTHDALAKIRAGEVRMRPRAFFVARAATTILVAGLTLALSATIMSFMLFSLRETGEAFLLGFGAQGLMAFFLLFPWLLLSIDIALLIFLDWLLRGFSFGYRFSLLSIFVAVVLASGALALIIDATPFHTTLRRQADHGGLPVAGPLYQDLGRRHADTGVFRGEVVSVASSSFMLDDETRSDGDGDTDDREEFFTVFAPPFVLSHLSAGDRVFVFGTRVGSTSVRAKNVQSFGALPQ